MNFKCVQDDLLALKRPAEYFTTNSAFSKAQHELTVLNNNGPILNFFQQDVNKMI